MAFNPTTINQLLQQTTKEVDGLSMSLSQDKLDSQKSELLAGNIGNNVDFTYIYGELESLIKLCKDVIQIIEAIEPDITNITSLAAVTKIIDSIRGLISEFTIIHRMNIKHMHNIEIENIKQQNRLDTLDKKQELKNNTINITNNSDSNGIINTLPYSNDLMLEFEKFLQEKGYNE